MLHSICIPIAYLDNNTSYKIQGFITDAATGIFSSLGGFTLFCTVFSYHNLNLFE